MYSIDFEVNILKFLIQKKEGLKYKHLITTKLFAIAEHITIFSCINEYYEQYKKMPSKANLVEFFSQVAKVPTSGLKSDIINRIIDYINKIYEPCPADLDYVKDKIVDFAQEREVLNLFNRFGTRLANKTEVDTALFQEIKKDINKIVDIRKNVENDTVEDFFILRDYKKLSFLFEQGHGTKLISMNNAMVSKGFKPPEIIVVMAGPKSGKTNFLVNIAVGYLQDGLNVLYIDTENGVDRIKRLTYQCMTNFSYNDLVNSDTDDTLSIISDKIKLFNKGADMRIEFLPPYKGTVMDVENICDRLYSEHAFKPDVIICDYFDNMAPTYYQKDKRLNLQYVYMDWKRFAEKANVFVFTVSQVNRQAIDKETFSQKDIAEDFGKIANADSVWAICRTDNEVAMGVGRLVAVANRSGKDNVVIPLKIDLEKCQIYEPEKVRERSRQYTPTDFELD